MQMKYGNSVELIHKCGCLNEKNPKMVINGVKLIFSLH